MKNNRPPASSNWSSKSRGALYALAIGTLFAWSACQSAKVRNDSEARGIIIINAPVTGQVRRILVSEGVAVNEGAPLVEIAALVETNNAASPQGEDPLARAGRNIRAAQAEIEAARAEVVRHEVEVQRLTPLVASGDAPQGQLDGERAEYDRAQQRLQRALGAAQEAQGGLIAARQPSRNATTTAAPSPSEQIVAARASSAGTVSAISARVGERVTAGQPLATLRSDR